MKKRGKWWLVLPEEIISQIITGLDLKSIIKYMLVCKEWRNLISHLISNNPNLGAKGQVQFLGYDFELHRFGTLDDDTHEIVWMKTLYSPWRIKSFVKVAMSSSNGLVCLLSTLHEDVHICNPITGEHISLFPNVWSNHRGFTLGFCPSSNEYKLTIFHFLYLEVLTLGNPNSGWRTVPFQPPFPEFACPQDPVICVDGVLHWLLKTHSILTFDLAEEVVGSVPLPRLEPGKEIYQLGCMDRCLVVTAGQVSPFLGLEMWARKEEKSSGELVWTKNLVIDDAPPLVWFKHLVPRKLLSDGRIIMTYKYRILYSLYYSYDPREKRVRPHHSPRELHCFDYTPTLVSPKKLMERNGQQGSEVEGKEGN